MNRRKMLSLFGVVPAAACVPSVVEAKPELPLPCGSVPPIGTARLVVTKWEVEEFHAVPLFSVTDPGHSHWNPAIGVPQRYYVDKLKPGQEGKPIYKYETWTGKEWVDANVVWR